MTGGGHAGLVPVRPLIPNLGFPVAQLGDLCCNPAGLTAGSGTGGGELGTGVGELGTGGGAGHAETAIGDEQSQRVGWVQ